MQQTDVRMQGRSHHLVGSLGVTLCDRDCRLVVQAEQHLRRTVAEVVDEAVVQPAVARARVERDVRDVE
jgi:hypothetical protein